MSDIAGMPCSAKGSSTVVIFGFLQLTSCERFSWCDVCNVLNLKNMDANRLG